MIYSTGKDNEYNHVAVQATLQNDDANDIRKAIV